MNILIVTNFLPPKIGGIERLSHELASALQKKGTHQVTVASAEWPKKYVESKWAPIFFPYRVIYFPSLTLARRLPLPNVFSLAFWKQMKYIGEDYDIVFFQSHVFILNWILAIKFRRCVRRIWMNHGCNYAPMQSLVGKVASFSYERLGMIFMKAFCNEFVGQSGNAAEWISSKTGMNFGTLTNAVNLEHFEHEVKDDVFGLKSRILFVGRFVEGKGVLDCIEAVSKANAILIARGESELFKLTMIGSGPLSLKLKDVDYPFELYLEGELEHSQVISSMYESDILIQAYTQPEGLSTVTLEGLAAGMLVVTTPLSKEGGLDKCINYIPGSFSELPHLLLECRDRNESRSELVTIGKKFVKAGLTWDVVSEKLVKRDY